MRAVQGFDRVVVGVKDPATARDRWRALGFAIDTSASDGMILLDDARLELRGAGDGAGHGADRGVDADFLDSGDGLFGLAFVSDDLEASRSTLRDRAARKAKGKADEILVPASVLPGVAAMVHERDGAASGGAIQPNGAITIHRVTLCIEQPRAHSDACRAFFGGGSVVETDEILTIRTGRQSIIIARPDDVPLLHPQIDMVENPVVPRLVALGVQVADTGTAAAVLEENGVGFTRLADGSLSVSPEDATGVLLELGDRL